MWLGVHNAPRAAPAASACGGTSADGGGVRIRDALRTRAFWALFFAYMCTPLAVFTVVTHQVAFAVDHGFPRLFVAGIFGLTGFMSIAGRVVFGYAADRIGRALSATISYACTAVGTLALLSIEPWPHPAGLYVYALLFGLGFGARGPIITAIAAARFPGRRFGAIYGYMSIGNGFGGAHRPVVRRRAVRPHRQLPHPVLDRHAVLRRRLDLLLARRIPIEQPRLGPPEKHTPRRDARVSLPVTHRLYRNSDLRAARATTYHGANDGGSTFQ